MKQNKYKVSYTGFLQKIEREFPSKETAIRWCHQAGVFNIAKIEKIA